MKITRVRNTGDASTERVVLVATADCNVGDFILTDTTYDSNGEPSNKFRHVFLFPKQSVKNGDLIVVWSKSGKYHVTKGADEKTRQHNFYWGLKESIWNITGDMALLLEAPRAKRQAHKVLATTDK